VQEGEVAMKRRRRIITKATTVDHDHRSMLRGINEKWYPK
jgi:hypothetical protein